MKQTRYVHVVHVNLLGWRNLIGSLSRDVGQYPMIGKSNSGYRDGRLVTLIKTNKLLIKINKSWQLFTSSVKNC